MSLETIQTDLVAGITDYDRSPGHGGNGMGMTFRVLDVLVNGHAPENGAPQLCDDFAARAAAEAAANIDDDTYQGLQPESGNLVAAANALIDRAKALGLFP